MSWIVVDDSAKGSIGSSTATLRGTHRASSMRSRSSTATASTASAMHIGSAAQKQQQRRRASSNTRNGASGNGSRHVDASKRLLGSGGRKVSRRKHTHAVQASNEASHADDAPQQQYLGVKTEEMELLQHALDGAWGKFGEARVLTQQRCFQDAWKALMEAKQLIDRAAGSSCCITRHYQALVQLGHELNAATQSWLLREQPGQEQAPTKPAMAYSSLASETTRAPPQHQQHPMGSTGGVEEAEAEEELRLEQNDDTIAHQHPVEASVSMKIRGKNTNIYLGCDNCEDDGVAVTCRVTPSKASRFAPSRLRDVWNLVSPKSPPRLYDAYGKPAAKFSDGIVTPVNGANGRGVLRSSSFSLFHPSVPTEAMYVLRRQKQEQTETEKEEESHPQQRSQQRNPSPLSPRPLPSPLQQQQQQQQQQQVREAENEKGPSHQPHPQLQQQQETQERREPSRLLTPKTASEPRQRDTLLNMSAARFTARQPSSPTKELPSRSITDIGEPQVVPLYAFEVVKPKPSRNVSQLMPPFASCTLVESAACARLTNTGVRKLMPARFGSSGSMHSPNGNHAGGGRRLSYVSLYNLWQGKDSRSRSNSNSNSGVASPHSQGARQEDKVGSTHNVIGLPPPAPDTASAKPVQSLNNAQCDHEESSNASQVSTAPLDDNPDGNKNENTSGGDSEEASVADALPMSLTEMYFRRCFEGVQSYQEARGLHQRLVQQLLVVRAAEERSGGDSNASAPEFRAAHWLGKLEDAYHDWLVDHLGIKSRQRQSTDQPLLSTVTVTIEESTQLESGRGATPVPVKCGAGAGTGTTPLSPNLPSSSDRLETALAYGRSVPLTSNEASAARGGTTPPVAGVTMVPSESAAKNRVDSAAADASHEATPPSPALAEAESAAVVKGDSVAAAPFTPSVTGAVLGLKQNEEEEEQQQQQHEEKQKQCPEENGGAVSRRRAGRAFLFLREQLC